MITEFYCSGCKCTFSPEKYGVDLSTCPYCKSLCGEYVGQPTDD